MDAFPSRLSSSARTLSQAASQFSNSVAGLPADNLLRHNSPDRAPPLEKPIQPVSSMYILSKVR